MPTGSSGAIHTIQAFGSRRSIPLIRFTRCASEAPHQAGAAERHVYFIAHSQFQADRWHKRTLAAIREERAVGVESLRERFVLLPPAEFEALTKRLDAENLSLDELSGEDIRRLIGKG